MTTLGTACAGGRFPRGAPSTVARGTFVLVSAMMLAPVTAMPTASDSTTMYSFEKRSNTHFQGIRWQNALGFLAACCGVFCGMVLLAIILKFANPPHMEARHHTQGMYQYPVQGPAALHVCLALQGHHAAAELQARRVPRDPAALFALSAGPAGRGAAASDGFEARPPGHAAGLVFVPR